MKKPHCVFCADCCLLFDFLHDLADEVLACESGEVLELDLGNAFLHIVVVEDEKEDSDD